MPVPCEARSKAGSFPHLKVAGGGISSHRPAGQGRKRCDLLGRRDWNRQLLKLRARVCTQGAAPSSASGDEKRAAEYVSALSRQGDVLFMLYEDSMNQLRLIQFMNRLVRTSKRKVFLILDNLKVHHGKKAAAWLDRHRDKIELFLLPPYAPESNPDEYLNHALNLWVHSGSIPQTKRDIRHKAASFMRSLLHCHDKVSAFFQHNQISYVLDSVYTRGRGCDRMELS